MTDSDSDSEWQPDEHMWTLVETSPPDDTNDEAYVENLIEAGGQVPAVKVHICVKDASVVPSAVSKAAGAVPVANLLLKPVVKGVEAWTGRAAGHHFTVVEFASEVVPGSGKRFLRIDRLIHYDCMDPEAQTPTGLGLDRAELISSMQGMKVYKNHSFRLKTTGRDRAVFGDVLHCWLEMHRSNPRYDGGAGAGILRQKGALNCQAFAEELVNRLRQSHASIFRRALAKVDNSSHVAAAGARVTRAAVAAAQMLNSWVEGGEGGSSTDGSGKPAAQGHPGASTASMFTKGVHVKRAALHLKQPRLA